MPGLPPLTSGAVGYIGYEAVRWIENIPDRHPRETASSAIVAPMTRNQATVWGATSSNRTMAIAAPMYWARAERTKRASG